MARMNWKPVKDFLRREILKDLDDPTAGEEWLARLAHSPNGDVLASCIVIDVASGALRKDTVIDVLNHADLMIADARMAFHAALVNHDAYLNLICSSCFHSSPLPKDDTYVRVISLQVFMDNYIVPEFGPAFVSTVKADREAVKRTFFDTGAFKLGSIRSWWTGSHPLVWITSLNTLVDVLDGEAEEDVATVINDYLGLGYPEGVDLLWVQYPSQFDCSIGVAQPTTLDVPWKAPSGFYISYPRKDGWGRAQSCSGTRPNAYERVHSHFKNLTDSYVAELKGCTKSMKLSRGKLILEANKRVKRALAEKASLEQQDD